MTQLSDFSAGLPLPAAPDLRRGSAAEQFIAEVETPSDSEKLARLERENAALLERATDAEKGWRDVLLERGRPEQRNAHEILTGIAQLAEEQLAELKHVRAALSSSSVRAALSSSSDSRSSVEVKTSTRGYDISVKAYEGSPADGLVDAAIAMYGDAYRQVEAQRLNGWQDTVDDLAAETRAERLSREILSGGPLSADNPARATP